MLQCVQCLSPHRTPPRGLLDFVLRLQHAQEAQGDLRGDQLPRMLPEIHQDAGPLRASAPVAAADSAATEAPELDGHHLRGGGVIGPRVARLVTLGGADRRPLLDSHRLRVALHQRLNFP